MTTAPTPSSDATEVAATLADLGALPEALIAALRQEAAKFGHPLDELAEGALQRAVMRLERDPYSGSVGVLMQWRNSSGRLQGELRLHRDGPSFAEYEILQPHPKRSGFFIEAVTAWGRVGDLRSELRLLEMPQ